ncbi:tail fiber assembly protein [Citrobacter freundii]|nr:tail fiber assembly protein [Citrobacter freundii]MDE9684776.1 tail fiber assembly protein [Citrobacter freundii]
MYLFSPSTLGFYPIEMKAEYLANGSLPSDVIEVSDSVRNEYNFSPPEGKQLSSSQNMPVWIDIPPATREELIAAAERKKQQRIIAANDFMNSKQWQGKAAIGRLKGGELTQYNLWLDYLDALDGVDTSSAPDIEWPMPPGEQAS